MNRIFNADTNCNNYLHIHIHIYVYKMAPGSNQQPWFAILNSNFEMYSVRVRNVEVYTQNLTCCNTRFYTSQKYKKFRLILSCSDTTEKSISYIWYFELYDVWRCAKLYLVIFWLYLISIFWLYLISKIASSIDWLEEKQKEVGNRPKNTGWISVDCITKDTLSTYNTWIQISRLQKIYHPHWAKWLLENSFPLGAAYATTLRNTKPFITAIHFMQCP